MTTAESDNTFCVERETVIHASATEVFSRLDNFHRWVDWSPWEGIDENMQRTYSGPDAGVGAVYAWDGNRKAGKGEMRITSVVAPTSVKIDLAFLKPFKSRSDVTFTLAPSGDTTHVTWTMIGPKTLMSRIMGVFMSMDKIVGRDFEKGLAQLKTMSEAPTV